MAGKQPSYDLLRLPIAYDMTSHHALGGGSYVFESNYAEYLRSLLPHPEACTEINIIIQPNASPHVGTLASLGLAFVLARHMRNLGAEAVVVCDLWDRAKGEQIVINDISYQRSLRDTGKLLEYIPEYEEILAALSQRYEIEYRIRFEEEFLQSPGMSDIIQQIIEDRERIAKCLAPSKRELAIRAACPQCGLVDKYGVNNIYTTAGSSTTVSFNCPDHGRFLYEVKTQAHKFQFNCQLFNLVIGLYHERASHNYIEICGSDYAGFWQEQLLWRFLKDPILIVYTPLISDWSGSKISKTQYLQRAAYDYLKTAGQEYLLSYRVSKAEGKDLALLWREIELWVEEPYRLFRGYSLHYIHLLFERASVILGTIHNKILETEG
ncbi:hypothetical protein BJX64DRAFT_250884 [Aspergillus heterothallicus]